jgi:predicted component of viral defense system (DUF524 family)
MDGTSEVSLDVTTREGHTVLAVRISLLPGAESKLVPAAILDYRGVPERDDTLEPVQLLEGMEYRYAFIGDSGLSVLTTDHPEVFAPDDSSGRTGRLRPGLFTGSIHTRIFADGRELGATSFEVRSRKLRYLTDYRRMIADVADAATEVVMDRFASSEQSFSPSDRGDPLTLYQRFAFLEGLFANESFQAALHQVLARPYETWETVEEERAPAKGVRGRSTLARELSRSGPRVPWPESPLMVDLPASIRDVRTEATLDTAPNQFVKFALGRWREVAQQLHDAMGGLPSSAAAQRGVRESRELLDKLDAVLAEELFREVGDLAVFPSGNQVLQKREGYRDILRAYVQFEVAAQLTWAGGDDVFEAGQRDVATLYEYWAYIQVARLLSELCEIEFGLGNLLTETELGVGLDLRKGRRTLLPGKAVRLGRGLEVELWFNKGFSGPTGGTETSWVPGSRFEGSWTVGMRPDISVRITPDPGALEYCDPIWVHFDAKYRVERVEELLGDGSADDAATPADDGLPKSGEGVAKREDLLKMHAYRDAIRLSAGAYVLYPGTQNQKRRAYTEILPGLGAFRLRPDIAGEAEGVGELRIFLDELLTHAARQASQDERARFWNSRVRQGRRTGGGHPSGPLFLAPPDDTMVLVGFVKSLEHAAWIRRTKYYNLRADGRRGSVPRDLLDCDVLLLWGKEPEIAPSLWRVGKDVETMSADELQALEYPQPRGERYYCLHLTDEVAWQAMAAWSHDWIESALSELSPTGLSGSPVLLSWGRLIYGTKARVDRPPGAKASDTKDFA